MNQPLIRTPDQRLRVFVSSTLGELASERQAVRSAIERLRLSPVMFEDGARPHPPRALYRAYLEQSHVFIGMYWQRYGWTAEGESISGLEDEYRLSGDRPRLLYIKEPAPEREPRLTVLIKTFVDDDRSSYRRFGSTAELTDMVERDLALLLTERFEAGSADIRPSLVNAGAPVPLTRTLGRVADIERVRALLAEGRRLVTLTGPGGVGKTRLALALAAGVGDEYPDGILFVPLQAVRSAGLVARVIVDRIGVRTEGAWTPEAALASHFANRKSLLILDNLEQIEGIEPVVREMLERTPQLQILATSRRALRIVGEQEYPVPTLPVPIPGAKAPEEPTVDLFMDRALAVNPDFAPGAEEMRAIEGICRRVDGLPLAIELAAARIRLMPPTELLGRLGGGFEILGSQSKDRPERQQTLRATLEWSYGLLSPDERSLLNRLSVFEGSFSMEAAEALADPNGEADIVTGLTSLLDSSLVIAADDPDQIEPRFRMLQTVQSHARKMLRAAGEEEAMARRHLEWFTRLCAEAQPFLCGPNQRSWAARFDQERANLRAAISTAMSSGNLGTVVEIVWDVAVFYEIRDASEEPRAWIREVVDRQPRLDSLTDAKLRSIHALFRASTGDFGGADAVLQSAREVFLAHDLALEAAVTLMVEAELSLRVRNDLETAMALLERSTALFRSVDHDWGVARTEITMSLFKWKAGDIAAARRCLNRSLENSRRIDNDPQIARALCLLAMLTPGTADAEEPRALLRDAARIIVRGQFRTEAVACLEALALNSHRSGRHAEVGDAVALSRLLRGELGLPPPLAVADALAMIRTPEQSFGAAPPVEAETFSFLSKTLLATAAA